MNYIHFPRLGVKCHIHVLHTRQGHITHSSHQGEGQPVTLEIGQRLTSDVIEQQVQPGTLESGQRLTDV